MPLPTTYKELVTRRCTSDFRKAVEIVTVPMLEPGPDEVLIKTKYVGVNATDVNVTAGRYGKDVKLGLEAVGEIVSVGKNVKYLKAGQPVATFIFGAYTEYLCVHQIQVFSVPDMKPEYVSLLVSGLTATIGMDKAAQIKSNDKVLVTAAAGALGQIVVQYCKQRGCHVIGLTSSSEKAKIITDLGCDCAINYKDDDLDKTLTEKYPDGVDVIWETIGGNVFETLMRHLAVKGKLIVVGAITGYRVEGDFPDVVGDIGGLPLQLLRKSASLRGFNIANFSEFHGEYFVKLLKSVREGETKINLDDGSQTTEGKFTGLEGIIRAVEHLHTGKSTGKVYVTIQ